jgi:hypothetical protein
MVIRSLFSCLSDRTNATRGGANVRGTVPDLDEGECLTKAKVERGGNLPAFRGRIVV